MDGMTMGSAGRSTRAVTAAARSEAYRDRRRRGVRLVTIEVEPMDLAGLERLGLLPLGERDPYHVGCAIARFLAALKPVAAIGEALWPADGTA